MRKSGNRQRNLKGNLKGFTSGAEGSLKGFTLIELLLYCGLVAIFLTAVIYFAWDVILGNVKAGTHQEVQENLRFASHRIEIEIKSAGTIDTAGSNFGVNFAANPEARLSLLGSAPYYPIKFRVDQGALQVNQGGGDWTSLTSSLVEVTDLTFTDLTDVESENIHFTLSIRHRNPSGRSEWEKEDTFESSVQLR